MKSIICFTICVENDKDDDSIKELRRIENILKDIGYVWESYNGKDKTAKSTFVRDI